MADKIEIPENKYGLDKEETSPLSSSGISSPLTNTDLQFDDPTANQNYKVPNINFNQGGTGSSEMKIDENFDSKSYIKNLVADSFGQVVEKSQDPYSYQKSYAFNPETDERQNQNFERYYSHSSFNKLGFNPWSDNEARYDEFGSKLGDVQRAVKSGARLLYTGFTSPLRSYADLFQGNPQGLDYTSAQEMSHLNTVGASSKGGATGFVSNLFVNSGYTVGLIGELVLEDIALGALAPETGGGSLAVAGTRTFNAAKNLGNYFNGVKGLSRAMENLKNFSVAATAYKAFKATGKFLNPLENSVEAIRAINASENITNLAKASKTAGAFYRDLRSANLVLAESKMEGAATAEETRKNLIDKYYAENGKSPDIDELNRINQVANDAGDNTMYANIPAIYLTNKLVFDNMFKRFKNMDDFVTKYRTKIGFEKGKGFEVAEENLKTAMKGLLKPKMYGKVALNYFKGNLAEGLQESVQEVISGAAKDYYTNLYKNPSIQCLDYSVSEAVSDNITKQFTGQGFETFASGFFMGGLIGVGGRIGTVAKEQLLKIKDKDRYAAYQEKKKTYAQNQVDKLNELYKDPLKYFGSGILNYANASQEAEGQNLSSVAGDNKVWQDWNDQSVWSHITTALDTNTFDVFMNHIDDIKTMNNEAIKEAYGVNAQEVLSKINKIKQRAEDLKDAYNHWNEKAPNPFDPSKYKKDSSEYNTQAISYYAWNQAKNHAIWYNHSFDRNQKRIESIVGEILNNLPIAETSSNDFKVLVDPNLLRKEVSTLKKEISSLKEVLDIPGSKKDLKYKEKKLSLLKNYRDALEDFFVGQVMETSPESDTEDVAALLQRSPEKLKKIYEEHVKHIASENKGNLINKNKTDDIFEKILDVHRIAQDNVNLSSTINILADPAGFHEYYDRLNKIMSDLYNDRSVQIENSVKETQARIETNTLLNTLYKRGFVVDAKDLENLIEKNELPDHFYDVASKQVVTKDVPQYDIFELIVRDYINAKEGKLVETPVTEEKKSEIKLMYQGRESVELDARNYDYWTESEAEAKDYGSVLRAAYIDTTGFLKRKDNEDEYQAMRSEFEKQTGKIFDILDNTPEGLVTQAEFFDFLKAKGYKGLDHTGWEDNKYVVTFDPSSVKDKAPEVKNETKAEVIGKNVSFDVMDRLSKIKTGKELELLERELVGKLEDFDEASKLGLNSTILTELVEAKKFELGNVFDFEDIKVGNVVMMVDPRYGLMVVKDKNKNGLKLYKLGESENTLLTVKKHEAAKNIKYKYDENMQDILTEGLNSDEKDKANTNKKNSDNLMSDVTMLKKLQDDAKKEGVEKVDKDFFNNLGCK